MKQDKSVEELPMETNNIVEEARELSGILFHKGYGKQAQIIDKLLAHIEQEPKWADRKDVQHMLENLTYFDTMPDEFVTLLKEGITKPSPPQGIEL